MFFAFVEKFFSQVLINVTMLEVCIDSLQSAINAIHGGADEIEVCSSLLEGGLTPSVGLVKQIQNAIDNLEENHTLHESCPENCHCLDLKKVPKVNIMLRCRPGSDFCFNKMEMDTMLSDLEVFKELNVDGFVFGALTSTQNIDKESCTKIVDSATSIPVTFHRAFDVCREPLKSLQTIINLGFHRLLTSGQRASADDPEAMALIKELISKTNGRIDIMAGSGVTFNNAASFISLGCSSVHSSCKRMVPKLKVNSNFSMSTSDSDFLIISDEQHVKKLKENIKSMCVFKVLEV